MRLFQERNLPMTVFGCAVALERHKPAAHAIRASGFDVCCHGWRWIKHFELSEAEEREHIAKAVKSLQATVGERPLGWYCRYGPGVNTRRLIVEEGGFLYDSGYYGDELPFWKTVNGKPHLIVPYSLTNNDGKYAGWVGTSDQWFSFDRDAFDMLYKEGAKMPKMMSVGLHMRLIGHPARAVGLERLLDHIMKHDGVWVTRRLDIARHWAADSKRMMLRVEQGKSLPPRRRGGARIATRCFPRRCLPFAHKTGLHASVTEHATPV